MKPFERDCTFYRIQHSNGGFYSKKLNQFEGLSTWEENEQECLMVYSWLDPIRFNHKIIERNKKEIYFKWFKEAGFLCFFSNSESDLYYVTSKLLREFHLSLDKVFLFNYCKNIILNNTNHHMFQLISLQYRTTIGESEKVNTYAIDEIDSNYVPLIITSRDIICFNYKSPKLTYFTVDCASVVSFSDTDTYEEVVSVLKGVVKYLQEIY